MSQSTQEHREIQERCFRRKHVWIIGVIVVSLFGAGLGVLNFARLHRTPDVGGGLIIVADPGTRIYFGDKLMGTTQVSFSWNKLFGDESHEALAEKLPRRGNPNRNTHDLVLGAGDKNLHSGGYAIVGTENVQAASIEYLIRRSDGTLDQLFAYNLTWAPPNQPSSRYLLQVRLRKGNGTSTGYYNSDTTGTSESSSPEYMRLFGVSPHETVAVSEFTTKNPPPELAEEIKTKGLWEPNGGN
jgi:hypothetical protein